MAEFNTESAPFRRDFLFYCIHHPLSHAIVAEFADGAGCARSGAREFVRTVLAPRNSEINLFYIAATSDMRVDERGMPYYLLADPVLDERHFNIYAQWQALCLKRHSNMLDPRKPMPLVEEEEEAMVDLSRHINCYGAWDPEDTPVEKWEDVYSLNGHVTSIYIRDSRREEKFSNDVINIMARMPYLRWLHLAYETYQPVDLRPLADQMSRLTVYFFINRTSPDFFDSLTSLTRLK